MRAKRTSKSPTENNGASNPNGRWGAHCQDVRAAAGSSRARDFAATVRREGKLRLRQYLDANFYQRHGAGAGEATLDELLTGLLDVLAKVTAVERAWAN